ncbi:MAG: aldehyde dehydrogenase family protein, partial [Planctomycetota bacterium]
SATEATGLPPGTFSLLHGHLPETSLSLVQQPQIAAVGFTGSPTAGLAIAKHVLQRPRPIPVFAELGSTNPVFLLPKAMAASSADLARGLMRSMTFGNGQMCTKPGLIVVADDPATQQWIGHLMQNVRDHDSLPLLNQRVADGFDSGIRRLREDANIRVAMQGSLPRDAGPWHRAPVIFETDAANAVQATWLHEETFGPMTIIVRCKEPQEMIRVAAEMGGSLTATIHASDDELSSSPDSLANRLLREMENFAGRIVMGGWPTGMEIGPATMHGGPFPASIDGRSTSVGFDSIERFIRPVCYQR